MLVVLAFILGACSASEPLPIPGAVGPLVTVETRGGECFAAPCGSTIVLERNGRVHSAAKPPNELGIVVGPQFAALAGVIGVTDFAALRSRPFTGQCPTAFDGQEIVFEFGTPGRVERIATCEVEVDYASPLFIAVANALGQWVPFPLS